MEYRPRTSVSREIYGHICSPLLPVLKATVCNGGNCFECQFTLEIIIMLPDYKMDFTQATVSYIDFNYRQEMRHLAYEIFLLFLLSLIPLV